MRKAHLDQTFLILVSDYNTYIILTFNAQLYVELSKI